MDLRRVVMNSNNQMVISELRQPLLTISILMTFLLLLTLMGNSQTVIKMKRDGGVSVIPCKVNGLNLNFIFDTGASSVSLSMTEASFMLKNDYLSYDDIIDSQKYLDAQGNISEGIRINLKEIEIGGKKLYNVEASIVKNQIAPLLLGQSAISKLGKIQLDLESNTLTILDGKRVYDYPEEKAVATKPNLTVGQNYQGGTIYYLDETGIHGLLMLDRKIWVAPGRAIGTWSEAVSAIRNLENFWRLPHKDELNLLRLNKYVMKPPDEPIFIKSHNGTMKQIPWENDGMYWSLSSCSSNQAWIVDFANGDAFCENKSKWVGIIAVKSF